MPPTGSVMRWILTGRRHRTRGSTVLVAAAKATSSPVSHGPGATPGRDSCYQVRMQLRPSTVARAAERRLARHAQISRLGLNAKRDAVHTESVPQGVRSRPTGFLAVLGAVALLASACSAGSSAKVTAVHSSKVGADILEMAGRPVYVHLLSSGAPAACTVACLSEWPAVDASSVPPAESGVHASMLSTTLLAGGTRVLTYDGRRLYFFYEDTSSHVTGEGIESFGGFWYVVSPSGKPIIRRAVSPPLSSPSNSSY